MFTGLVKAVGEVVAVEQRDGGVRLAVDAPAIAAEANLGDSVAVSGVCLTVVARDDGRLAFDAVPETLARTTFGSLRAGSRVNLETPLRAADQLGGHFVQGHVDAVGRIRSVAREGDGKRIWIDAPADVLRYVVDKGSVAVDGTSLTVAEKDNDGFAVALVPHTLAATTLGDLAAGDVVNLEADVLAKYVERLLPR